MSYAEYQAEVTAVLQTLGNPARAKVVQTDKKSELDFLAIPVPVLRQAVKTGFSFYHQSPLEILNVWNYIWQNSAYFEVMSAATTYYNLQNASVSPEIWAVLVNWSERVENWDHSDQLARIYSFLLPQRPAEVYDTLLLWSNSTNQWLRRLSLVSLIHYTGKNAVFLPPEKVLPIVDNCLEDNRYYVQKAIGWVLREMGHVYTNEIYDHLKDNALKIPSLAFSVAIERRKIEERTTLKNLRKTLLQ
jgi:3-methyladenine DNA glycosylase AlkD